MKKKLVFLFMLLFLLPFSVKAKNVILACDYDKVLFTSDSWVQMKINIYDDKTSSITYMNESSKYDEITDGATYKIFGALTTVFDPSSSTSSTLPEIKTSTPAPDKLAGLTTEKFNSNVSSNDAYSYYTKAKNSCPVISAEGGISYTIGLTTDTSSCDNKTSFCSSATKTHKPTTKGGKVANTEPTLTKECINYTSPVDLLPGMAIKFRMYSDNTKELCVKIDGSTTDTCNKIVHNYDTSKTTAVAAVTAPGTLNVSYTISIIGTQMNKIFLNSSDSQHTFTCPAEIYVNETNGKAAGQYVITTDPTNAFAGTTNGDDTDSDTEGTDVADCGILGEDFLEYLKDAFNLIQVIGPILALVFSMVDMLKAVASGEDNAKQTAFKNTGKRLTAAVLLYMIPAILTLLFSIINKFTGSTCGIG